MVHRHPGDWFAWSKCLFVVVFSCLTTNGALGDETNRAYMNRLFADLQEVLPLTFKGKEFEANPEKVKNALANLVKDSHLIRKHGESKDPAFRYVADSLVSSAKEAQAWYAAKNYDEARYVLRRFAENCISCHTKLPAKGEYPVAATFFAKIPTKDLSLEDLAALQTAMRKFDDALTTYEKIIQEAADGRRRGPSADIFNQYLVLAIRVTDNLGRAEEMLKKLLNGKQQAYFQRLVLKTWIKSLQELRQSSQFRKKPSLKLARDLMKKGRDLQEFPQDRLGLIEFVAASKILQELVAGLKGVQLAEAYYLLGSTESLIGRTYWLSQAEFYLESAIRMAPKAKFAAKAFAVLEEQVYSSLPSDSEQDVLRDIHAELEQLRKLIESN